MLRFFCIVVILCNHYYFIPLKLLLTIKGFILYHVKQTALQLMANSWTPAELNNCKLENPSPTCIWASS